ncbi:MAG: ribosome biogenesis GTPase Der [bacterium]
MSLPVVAIIGRPNVGKSTLFNALIKRRIAITDDQPGVTRDRHYHKVDWLERTFMLIDTGGFLPRSADEIDKNVRRQAEVAIEEADLLVFLVDARVGPADIDLDIARQLQRGGKPTLLVVNKADNDNLELEASTFYSLGLGEPFPISALGRRHLGDLLDSILEKIPETPADEEVGEAISVAVIGRPNVGKSSLVNKLLGDDRLIVSDQPGTTRDSIDTWVEYENQKYLLIDTAGLRRKARVRDQLEFLTTLRTQRALQRAEIAAVLVEAPVGITGQDVKIIEQAADERKGVIVVVNKWDLVEKDTHSVDEFTRHYRREVPSLSYIPLLFISATTGQRVSRLLEAAAAVSAERKKRIPTAELNKWLGDTLAKRTPPARQGRFIKFFYISQADSAPPTFVFVVNYPKLLDKAYLRYLENQLRERFGFEGVSLRLKFNERERRKR